MFNIFKNKNIDKSGIIDEIKTILHNFKSPVDDKDIIAGGLVESIIFKDGTLKLILNAEPSQKSAIEALSQEIEKELAKIKGIEKILIIVTAHSENTGASPQMNSAKTPPPENSIRPPNIKQLIAVGSGKGGVGKSTIAYNLALALSKLGKKVGLIDADIYGPSVPTLLGLSDERADVSDENRIIPKEKSGIKAMSIGFIVPKDAALIWRGPMLSKALGQLFMGTDWGTLDYLIIDLPPGTGDVQLSLAQQANIDGVIMVATPQELALADVRRGIDMFKKAKVPVIGMIENMSFLKDEATGLEIDLFGRGGAKKAAEELGLPFLGEINFFPSLQKASSEGINAPDLATAQIAEIAKTLAK